MIIEICSVKRPEDPEPKSYVPFLSQMQFYRLKSLFSENLDNVALERKTAEDFSIQNYSNYLDYEFRGWLLGHPVYIHSERFR